MAADLALFSLTQQPPINPSSGTGGGSWMWNPNQTAANSHDDEDSWEVRAFAEDAGNVMGTTWPPRSYTCTFCRREFRSAQALGGHMNVHRRDRARLHQAQTNSRNPNISLSSSSTLLIPTQELVANGGVCFLYSLPNPNAIFHPSTLNNFTDNPSTLLPITPGRQASDNLLNYPAVVAPKSINSSLSNSSNTEASTSTNNDYKKKKNHPNYNNPTIEELDLELRLGRSSPSPSPS